MDRELLDFSSSLAEGPCEMFHFVRYRLFGPLEPGKFENCDHLVAEIALRALSIVGMLVLVAMCIAEPLIVVGIVSVGPLIKITRAVGFLLQKNGYTGIHSGAPDVRAPEKIKIMSWNVYGVGGGMSLDHGGVVHFRERWQKIAEEVMREKPHVVYFQEIYDTKLAEKFIEYFKGTYGHIFAHMGLNIMGSSGGGLMMTNLECEFKDEAFTNNTWELTRTFSTLTIKDKGEVVARVIGTHLIHDSADKRREQVAQIRASIPNDDIPTAIIGDLNIERKSAEGQVLSFLNHSADLGPTCTNRLVEQWDKEAKAVRDEQIDYISTMNGPAPENAHLVAAFDASYNTKTALSDHHGLVAEIRRK
jgi:hypothetical protein